MTRINTFSGIQFDANNPEYDDVLLEDVAHGLSNVCRYGGQCPRFYSVAEHSVLVSNLLEYVFQANHTVQLEGLFHDAHEAYLGDIPTPLKRVLTGYEPLATKVQTQFELKYLPRGIKTQPDLVDRADKLALRLEVEAFGWEERFNWNWKNDEDYMTFLKLDFFKRAVFSSLRRPQLPDLAKNSFLIQYQHLSTKVY